MAFVIFLGVCVATLAVGVLFGMFWGRALSWFNELREIRNAKKAKS